MLTGRFPYGGAHDDVKTIVHRQKLKSIKFPGRMTENGMFFWDNLLLINNSHFSARQIILRMVEPQVAKRATTKEILAHPWLAATKWVFFQSINQFKS